MKKIVVLPFLALLVMGPASGAADADFQYWNTNNISYRFDENWKMAVEEELRFGDNAGALYYEHTDTGITFSGIAKWFDVGVNYRLIYEKNGRDWHYIHQPHVNATVKYTVCNFQLSDRNRFEYRNREKGDDGWRYRNQFTIKYPIKIDKFQFAPYTADEFFVDFVAGELNKNRLYGGIDFKLARNLSLDVYYMWQLSKKSSHWNADHVCGTKLKLTF